MSEIQYNNLPKFSKDAHCIKCGSGNIITKYVPPNVIEDDLVDIEDANWSSPIEVKTIPEHLERTCECGYGWQEACIGQSQEEKSERIRVIEKAEQDRHRARSYGTASVERVKCECGWVATRDWNISSPYTREEQDSASYHQHVNAEVAKRVAEAGLA